MPQQLQTLVNLGHSAYQNGHYSLAQFYYQFILGTYAGTDLFDRMGMKDQELVRERSSGIVRATELVEQAWDALYYFQNRAKALQLVQDADRLAPLQRGAELRDTITAWDNCFAEIQRTRRSGVWNRLRQLSQQVLDEFPTNEEAQASMVITSRLQELASFVNNIDEMAAATPGWAILKTVATIRSKCDACFNHEAWDKAREIDGRNYAANYRQEIESRVGLLEYRELHALTDLIREDLQASRFKEAAARLQAAKRECASANVPSIPPLGNKLAGVLKEDYGLMSRIAAYDWSPPEPDAPFFETLETFIDIAEHKVYAVLSECASGIEKKCDWESAATTVATLQEFFKADERLSAKARELQERVKERETLRRHFREAELLGGLAGHHRRAALYSHLMRGKAKKCLHPDEFGMMVTKLRKRLYWAKASYVLAGAIIAVICACCLLYFFPI